MPRSNDMELIETVILLARDPGYVLIGLGERVHRRRDPAGTQVERPASYEADAVHQLLDQGLLTRGGTHHVHYGRRDGPATSVLVPRATTRMADRWASYRPLHPGPNTRT